MIGELIALGLNESELAFYDALADNESAVREMGYEILKKIAHELTGKLRNSASVDWQKRDSARDYGTWCVSLCTATSTPGEAGRSHPARARTGTTAFG